jgi:uncharacterized membrane protein YvbJ
LYAQKKVAKKCKLNKISALFATKGLQTQRIFKYFLAEKQQRQRRLCSGRKNFKKKLILAFRTNSVILVFVITLFCIFNALVNFLGRKKKFFKN